MAELTLGEVVAALEGLYPAATAQSWDRVGLVTGDLAQPVRRVHFAVDPTLAVIDEAVTAGADLLVAHHPLLLHGVSSVASSTAKGAAIAAMVKADLALFTAHTNADVASPGVSDALAAALGLRDLTPLQRAGGDGADREGQGIGRWGRLPQPMTLRLFAQKLAAALPAAPGGVRVAGDAEALVELVAVAGGAGDDLFDAVRASGADVYVTADLRHHPALGAREEARAGGGGTPYLVDAGHWASEWLWLPDARDRLVSALEQRAARLETHVSVLCTDPWDLVVGAVP